MHPFELPLVTEKKHWTLFLHPLQLVLWFLVVTIATIITLKAFSLNYSTPKMIVIEFGVWFSFWILSQFRFYGRWDYIEIGKIYFEENCIEIHENNKKSIFNLESNFFSFYFDGVRNRGIQETGKDFARRGISQLVINDEHNFSVIIQQEYERTLLKSYLHYLYSKQVVMDEFLRYEGQHRLVELNMLFDWKQFKAIEANNLIHKKEIIAKQRVNQPI